MIWINVWDRILCRFVRKLVSTGVAKAMPHIVFGSILACGPVTAHSPPPYLVPPSPYIPILPPPIIPYTPIPIVPVQPFVPSGPQWTFIPPGDAYQPISTPPVFLPETNEDIGNGSPFTPTTEHTAPICDTITPSKPITPTTPPTSVSAPGPLSWFVAACILLFLWKALGMQASVAK